MKKLLSSVLAAAMVASVVSISVFAAAPATPATAVSYGVNFTPEHLVAYDSDGAVSGDVTVDTSKTSTLTLDPIRPNAEIYIPFEAADIAKPSDDDRKFDENDFDNTKLWSVKLSKDEGSKLVKSVTVVSEKALGGAAATHGRTNWIKIVLNDTTSTSEQKFSGTLELKAKKSTTTTSQNGNAAGVVVLAGDKITVPLSFWVSNKEIKNDDNPDVGERVYVNPTKNETNTIVWGDDRAALTFDSHDDAGKFYARLNTKNDAAIWREYADPVDADLWFYEFVGSSTIPATSRATLTLGIPWDDDDDYAIDPEDAYIYEKDADGRLIDVTSKFTYSEDDAEIPGWSIKTRTLGTYIVSDTELDLDIEDEDEDVSEAEETGKTTTGAKPIPDTGASDMVNVAVVAGIVSLAAAGAVAFRKAK